MGVYGGRVCVCQRERECEDQLKVILDDHKMSGSYSRLLINVTLIIQTVFYININKFNLLDSGNRYKYLIPIMEHW